MKFILRIIKLLWKINKRLFCLDIFLGAFAGFALASDIYSTSILINDLQRSFTKGGSFLASLLFFCFVNIGIIVLNVGKNYAHEKFLKILENTTQCEIVEHCIYFPLKKLEQEETYSVIERAKEFGLETIEGSYELLIGIIVNLISMFSIFALILKDSNPIWLIIVIHPFLSMILQVKYGKLFYNVERENTEKRRKMNYFSFLSETSLAKKEILCFNLYDFITKKFKVEQKNIYDNENIILNKQTTLMLWLNSFQTLLKLIAIVVYIIEYKEIALGNVVGFISSLDNIDAVLRGMIMNFTGLYKYLPYLSDYFIFLDLPKEDISCGLEITSPINSLVLRDVGYSYNDKNIVLQNISESFVPGKIYVILGGNGVGKTTLLKIISSLYDEYIGEILVNGIEMKSISKKSFRRHISVVFQDYFSFEISFKENIIFDYFKKAEIKYANSIKSLGLSKLIDKLPNGDNTILGNRFGVADISKGQWQRVAIARALCKDADIYLFDEPFSALDTKCRQEVANVIKNIAETKIVIVITHDIKPLKNYDIQSVFIK